MKKAIKAKLVDVTEYCVGPLLEMLQENVSIEWTETDPDFVIHSSFGHDVLRHEGVRVCWLGENLVPDFNISDYAMRFSRLSFGDRYRRIPLYRWYKEYADLFDERRRVVSVSGAQALRDNSPDVWGPAAYAVASNPALAVFAVCNRFSGLASVIIGWYWLVTPCERSKLFEEGNNILHKMGGSFIEKLKITK